MGFEAEAGGDAVVGEISVAEAEGGSGLMKGLPKGVWKRRLTRRGRSQLARLNE